MTIINAKQLSVKHGSAFRLQPTSFSVANGQHLAIVGKSGSGKTTLLQALMGHLFCSGELTIDNRAALAFVPQQHQFTNLAHTRDLYYQQRFNTADAGDAMTVEATLPQLFDASQVIAGKHLAALLQLEPLRQRTLLQLSNGEHKRLQLAKVLLQLPQVLLLDHPYIGLDVAGRSTLTALLETLAASGITIILSCDASKLPPFVTHVLELHPQRPSQLFAVADFRAAVPEARQAALPPGLVTQKHPSGFRHAVEMRGVRVQYETKVILDDVSWTVKRGERWSLSGPNGAGKSTLLSLVTADNPQAYANEVYLFDRRRGSGESIWDIKRNIGYVSPELHVHFDPAASVFDTVASGLFDTIGLFRQPAAHQTERVMQWLDFLEVAPLRQRLLSQLPLGKQRLLLLARALVKQPPLLVLDEPLQGLDEEQSALFRSVVDSLAAQTDQTMIFVTHYAEDLPSCIDRHIRLEQGRVV